jgi:deaminated glutathione amidase
VRQAKERGARLLSLPECFAFLGEKDTDLLAFMRPLDDELVGRYRVLAKEHGLWLSLGGFQERGPDEQHAYNAHLLVDDEGAVRSVYRKLHLFDVDIPGGPRLRESKATARGHVLVVEETPVGKVGLSICYDLRFAELYLALRNTAAPRSTAPLGASIPLGRRHRHRTSQDGR